MADLPTCAQFFVPGTVCAWTLRESGAFTMVSPQAPNYLLANRKRLVLHQDEVAFLIGAESDERVCRHERFRRMPSLEEALAYEAVFKRSVSDLFSGQYARIDAEVKARAKALVAKIDGRKLTARAAYRRRVLAEIAGN